MGLSLTISQLNRLDSFTQPELKQAADNAHVLNYDKVQITCLGLRLGLGLVLGLLLGLVLGLVLANPKPNLSYGNRFGCCEQMITLS